MAGASDYLENALLDHIVGDGSFTSPTAYLALFTTAPTDSGGGTEVTGNNYSRLETAASDWSAATGGTKTNSGNLEFDTPSGSWGTVVAVGLYDASTSGNLLAWATLGASVAPESGDIVRFQTGDLDLACD